MLFQTNRLTRLMTCAVVDITGAIHTRCLEGVREDVAGISAGQYGSAYELLLLHKSSFAHRFHMEVIFETTSRQAKNTYKTGK